MRKVKILRAPKFDVSKLMEVHGDYTEEVCAIAFEMLFSFGMRCALVGMLSHVVTLVGMLSHVVTCICCKPNLRELSSTSELSHGVYNFAYNFQSGLTSQHLVAAAYLSCAVRRCRPLN